MRVGGSPMALDKKHTIYTHNTKNMPRAANMMLCPGDHTATPILLFLVQHTMYYVTGNILEFAFLHDALYKLQTQVLKI